MSHRTPRLEIYTDRIRQNAKSVVDLCHRTGVQVACVTKVTAAHPAVAQALVEGGADMLADSRVENLWALRQAGFAGPFLLLRLPTISEAANVVRAADISLNSNLTTLRALSEAAIAAGVRHKVIVMIDVGDLREGIWHDRAPGFVSKAKE
ncbi:MAG TPA: alanine racemase, partial [Candidatus Ozemobacteraceae bacterium]|nr:alanine racemase [Candidatus Ozemobacteraceae bacterium]